MITGNSKEECISIIYQCVEQVNVMLPSKSRMIKSPNSVILGEGGVFDSLSIINLLVSLEEYCQNKKITLKLVDEELLADLNGPYKSIDSLADYMLLIMESDK